MVYKRIFGFRKRYFYVLFCSISKGTFYGILVIIFMDSERVGYFWVVVLVFLVLWDYLRVVGGTFGCNSCHTPNSKESKA